MNITAYQLAERFVGTGEAPGLLSNPQILAMLRLDAAWASGDEIPWCSAFVNYIAWLLRLPRSKSLAARSWLEVGTPVPRLADARQGFDVVVLSRDPSPTAGHVGFFSAVGTAPDTIYLLGGNQGDRVCVAPFPASRILGVRNIWPQG
jgi:uncharacterized protein (TIGR02594 family)